MKIGVTERGDGGLTQKPWRDALKNKTVDGVVVITKAPHLLLQEPLPSNTIVNCTITWLGGTAVEPDVASPDITFKAALKLLELYGPERVVLRVDPILPDYIPNPARKPGTTYETHAEMVYWHISNAKTAGFERVRISFLDLYPHTRQRFERAGIKISQNAPFHADINWRRSQWIHMGKPELCGEPDLPCTGCVSRRDIYAMALTVDPSNSTKGQRRACACLACKTELLSIRDQCQHKCVYCYWK